MVMKHAYINWFWGLMKDMYASFTMFAQCVKMLYDFVLNLRIFKNRKYLDTSVLQLSTPYILILITPLDSPA